jgi:hypothetical protein
MRRFDPRKSAKSLRPKQGVLIRALVRFVLLCCFHAILMTICMVRRVFPLQLLCPTPKGPAYRVLATNNGSLENFPINFVTFLIQHLARSLPCFLVVAIANQHLTEILLKPLLKPISSKPELPTPSKMRIHQTPTRHLSTSLTHQNNNADLDIILVHQV